MVFTFNTQCASTCSAMFTTKAMITTIYRYIYYYILTRLSLSTHSVPPLGDIYYYSAIFTTIALYLLL